MIWRFGIIHLLVVTAQATSNLSYSPHHNESDLAMDFYRCDQDIGVWCDTGICTTKEQTCDGKYDCADGSDENIYCPTSSLEGRCKNSKGFFCREDLKCILREKVCDEVDDCPSGADEKFCTDLINSPTNSTCKGFVCRNGQCISKLWICDGHFDCLDESDEDVDFTCKHSLLSHTINDGLYCVESKNVANRTYKCIDGSFCLPAEFMCNGLDDCKDGSDEGPFCQRWFTMCQNTTCEDGATCSSERYGPTCICPDRYAQYNDTTKKCVEVNKCNLNRPQCSQICEDVGGKVNCSCAKGYIEDADLRRCFAPEPSGLLFYQTVAQLGYMELRTRKNVVLKNITDAHGPVSDGKYFYYVRAESGMQAIMKGEIDNFEETEKILFTVGIEHPHFLALDWLGGHLYFSDFRHKAIFVCQTDGLLCTRLPVVTNLPMYLTLDVLNGNMYWGDHNFSHMMRVAKMDGTQAKLFLDNVDLHGMALDPPNHRLYFLTSQLNAINLKIKNPQPYVIYTDQQPDIWSAIPRGIAVFENSIYWSDTGTFSVKITEKMSSVLSQRHHATRHTFLQLHSMPVELFIYHPLLMPELQSPCEGHNCSHFCFITSATTKSCGCPEGMTLDGNYTCKDIPGYYPEYLVIGSRNTLTRIQYNSISNHDTEATVFDIGVVRAMAFDNTKDRLFLYDGQRKVISYTNMSDFTLGTVHPLVDRMLDDVTDMQYDYSTDNLYFLNAGHSTIEVYSLRSKKRAVLRSFSPRERLINICIMPIHGKMLVAIDNGDYEAVTIDSFNLDGTQRKTIMSNNLKGPRITLDYSEQQDLVYVSDEGNGFIDFMSPEGKGRETYRQLDAPITGLAVTSTYVFYTNRSSSLLYWTPLSESSVSLRSVELGMFPNNSHLHIVATTTPDQSDTLLTHPCLTNHDCSDVCVQSITDASKYRCVCAPGMVEVDNECVAKVKCSYGQLYCFRSEKCIWKEKMCDGVEDCRHGEDEEGCNSTAPSTNNICFQNEKLCNGACIHSDEPCVLPSLTKRECNNMTHFVCDNTLCLDRALLCDTVPNCVDESDESTRVCLTPCADYEYSCGKSQCIRKTWVCDGDEDCSDGSDEIGCPNGECPLGKFRCENWECIDMMMRCDGKIDCNDLSDEKDCQEDVVTFGKVKGCEDWEYTCALNHSICLPASAKCNSVEECPGGTDEMDCPNECIPQGLFSCSHEKLCINYNKVCDMKADCLEGNDELEVNCRIVNRQPHKFTPIHSPAECHDGFPCGSGQCIEWDQVCDHKQQCVNGADEGKQCNKLCTPELDCPDICRPTPFGPQCLCPFGMKLDHHHCSYLTCKDDVCSQMCQNTRHKYVCQCYEGYSLRSDKHTCKANNGPMELIYVPANKSRVLSNKHKNSRLDSTLFYDPTVAIVDIGVQARSDLLYIVTDRGELIIMKGSTQIGSIANIGKPSRVAVEWMTGNVYLADNTPGQNYMRVCNFEWKACAKLQKLPPGGDVLSMAIDIRSTLIFYCVSNDDHHTIWSSTLSGHNVRELALVNNCTGLAVETYKKLIYIAENDPDHIMVVDYDGVKQRKLAATNPHVRSPQNLAIFEDYIYFLRANSRDLARCLLFGPKTCEIYLHNMFDTSLYVIKHEAMQREVYDGCLDMPCPEMCVLDEDKGAKCLCKDGSVSPVCSEIGEEEMPVIQDLRPKTKVFAVIAWIITTVIAFMLTVYFCIRRGDSTQAEPAATYAAFRASTTRQMPAEQVSFHMGGPERPPVRRGYQNPFEFVPNLFRRTFRRSGPRRPVFNPLSTQGQSDTTSGVSSLPTASKSSPEKLPSMIPAGPSTESLDSISKEKYVKTEGTAALDLLMSPTEDTTKVPQESEISSKKASTSEEGSVESMKGLLKPSSSGSSDGKENEAFD